MWGRHRPRTSGQKYVRCSDRHGHSNLDGDNTIPSQAWTGAWLPLPGGTVGPPLLGDEPRTAETVVDIFGQRAIVDTLAEILAQGLEGHRSADTDTDRVASQRTIALFGRYGQGKSTVLRMLRE